VLFHMADNVLTPEEQKALLRRFADFEDANHKNGHLERFITGIEGLEAIYGVLS